MARKRKIRKDWERIPNPFKWKPLEERLWKFGPPMLPEKPDPRRPEYYLDARGIGKMDVGLYFVNVSDEVIPLVTSNTDGFETLEEDVFTIEGPVYEYRDVKPDEAVKIESFNILGDSDSTWSAYITVHSTKWGIRNFYIVVSPRGMQKVLLWDTGEEGKNEIVGW